MPQVNPIVQKIVLKTDEYSASAKKAASEFKASTAAMNKAMFESSKQFVQQEVQVKKWGQAIQSEAGKAGRALGSNLMVGAKALTIGLGSKALSKAAEDATSMAFSFSKAFAEIKSRSNASEKDLQSWRNSLMQISADTTANMDSMAESFKDMFSSVKNPDELLAIMGSIGAAAAMGDGDATQVSGFVKSTLQGQGRDLTKGNVDDVLGGADLLRRRGNGFANIEDAMGAMGSISGQELQRSKLSERQLAALMAGATNTGSEKGAAVAGLGELISKSNNGILEGSVLAGILGKGSLTNKAGQFDVSKLSGGYDKVLGMGGGNENKAREIFKATPSSRYTSLAITALKKFTCGSARPFAKIRLSETVRPSS
ncbi:MAG: hypothetical protein EOP06_18750 [Proteobacteria bacterium]|nr:MAG: hypothetical protein EOP06_18750 [Pseudomonadota bacterium]